VSTRSPVFKERPLPKSKKEAIDLMMENANLIKRPILIRGSKVTFGFDREAYTANERDRVSPRTERSELRRASVTERAKRDAGAPADQTKSGAGHGAPASRRSSGPEPRSKGASERPGRSGGAKPAGKK